VNNEQHPKSDALVPLDHSGEVSLRSASLVRRGLDLLRAPRMREVRFPEDRSIGVVYARGWGDSPFWYWGALPTHWGDRHGRSDSDDWRVLGHAKGTVSVPAEVELGLRLFPERATSLPWLKCLSPHDLQLLSLERLPVGDDDIDDLHNLYDVRILNLAFTRITDTGLPCLMDLARLEELSLRHTKAGGTGVPHWTEPRPNIGLINLEGLTELKRLDLCGTRVLDDELHYIIGHTLLALDLSWTAVSDWAMIILSSQSMLQELNICDTSIGNNGLSGYSRLPSSMGNIDRMTELRRLYMRHTCITDDGIMYIGRLPRLLELDLRATNITSASVRHLSGLTSLRKLYLDDTKVDDAGLSHLAGLTELQSLWLSDLVGVSDAGISQIGALTELRELCLDGTTVTDRGLAYLRDLVHLETLSINRLLGVSDAGLIQLGELSALRTLNLGETSVTEQGVAALRRMLPECDIAP
jgi:hypothetical protein